MPKLSEKSRKLGSRFSSRVKQLMLRKAEKLDHELSNDFELQEFAHLTNTHQESAEDSNKRSAINKSDRDVSLHVSNEPHSVFSGLPSDSVGGEVSCTVQMNADRNISANYYREDLQNHLGDAESQFQLGKKYHNGDGVSCDYIKAVVCYLKSAELGHAGAQNNLGVLYSQGLGVTKNEAEAKTWFLMAAEQGFDVAQYNVACDLVEEDSVEAAKWYRQAADQGNSDSQFCLAELYEQGIGVEQDIEQAKALYVKAAFQGNEDAQIWLDRRAVLESEQQVAQPIEIPPPSFGADEPYRIAPDSARSIVRIAIDLIKLNPASFATEIAELRELALADMPEESAKMAFSSDSPVPKTQTPSADTLPDVFSWLATQDRVSLADLRNYLRPLDLLPGAVIDELNERALDLTGEIALEESSEEILVFREVLATVIANQKQTP